MISDELIEQIKFEEGLRLKAYLCPAGKLTIGYGRNLDAKNDLNGNKIPIEITKDQAEAILFDDLVRTSEKLHAAWHGMSLLTPARRDACINMAFQMGIDGFLGFKKMREHLLKCDWLKAHDAALDSAWAEQTPARSKRVAKQLLTGEYYALA
jgi:lysozyme